MKIRKDLLYPISGWLLSDRAIRGNLSAKNFREEAAEKNFRGNFASAPVINAKKEVSWLPQTE